MRPNKIKRRREKALDDTVDAIQAGTSIRKAAQANHVPKSTAFDRLQARRTKRQRRYRTAFTEIEENNLVEFVLSWADKGVPLTRRHLVEATSLFISTMSAERRRHLPFKNDVPGPRWVRLFYSRHRDALKLALPYFQEEKRYAAVNAETLTSHFAKLQALVEEYELDAEHVWNLDESGISPGRDAKGSIREYRIVRKESDGDTRVPVFSYTNRITIMACVSAGGVVGPSLWVFKGMRLPYREVIISGSRVTETLSSYLPRSALVAMEPSSPGVNSSSFFQWAQKFTASIQHIVGGGRKVLLTYDGYRSHMTLKVLEHLRAHGVVVYALPAHTSGKTQPCDTGIFRAFKNEIGKAITDCCMERNTVTLDKYRLCSMLRHAYRCAFTVPVITAAFKLSGVWPVDRKKLITVPRPRDFDDVTTLISAEKMEEMYQKKLLLSRKCILGDERSEVRRGFIDTTRGCVLTSDKALSLVRAHAEKWRNKEEAAAARAARKEHDQAQFIVRAERNRQIERARLASMRVGDFLKQVRPISERRRAQAEQVSARREAAEALISWSKNA